MSEIVNHITFHYNRDTGITKDYRGWRARNASVTYGATLIGAHTTCLLSCLNLKKIKKKIVSNTRTLYTKDATCQAGSKQKYFTFNTLQNITLENLWVKCIYQK